MSRSLGDLYARAAREAIPLEVAIELTHRCNFRCRHCYIPDFEAPDLLTTGRVLELLEELAGVGTLRLSLTGGEPLLRPDWRTVARRARELGFQLTVLTNGSGVTDDVAEELARLHAVVDVSLHTMDRAAFERLTRRVGSFERVLAGIRRLRAHGVPVVVKVPQTSITPDDLEAVAAFAEEVGAICQSAPQILPRKDGSLEPLRYRLDPDRLAAYYGGPHGGCDLPAGDAADRDDLPLCAAGNRFACIQANGDVLACNVLPVVAGNVLERTFREVWEGSEWLRRLRSLRRRDLPVCSGCDAFVHCNRCHAEALLEDGDLLGPASAACARAAARERAAAARAASLPVLPAGRFSR